MPYNKGDFTQQGIAGDVTSLVRLNEKRTVKLTLSADDASDNCDISGSVIDELNNKTYPIGSGVSGNIEITENGENINVAPYATATVNVSGGGSTAKTMPITITNNTANDVFLEVPLWLDSGYLGGGIEIPANDTVTIDANIFYYDSDDLYSVLLNGSRLSSQDAEYDEVNSTASYATLDFDGAYCEIDLTSPPNPDAAATIYIIDA